jgi:hypothetical protein
MKFIALVIGSVTRFILNLSLLAIFAGILFIAYRVNQPMRVPEAPQGMTYYEFMVDRFDAAKTVKPTRCGTGMIGSLFALGPFYATLYTHVGLHPNGFWQVTAHDPDMPRFVSDARWYEIPEIGGQPLNGCPGPCWQSDIKDAASAGTCSVTVNRR